MLKHQSARIDEITGKRREKQRLLLANALEGTQRALDAGNDLRLKTYANKEIRISFPAKMPVPAPGGSEEGVARCLDAAEAALVYNDKVQHGFEIGLLSRSRCRPVKLTRYAAHRVREACAVIERDFGLESYFVTLTLPGSTPEALKASADEATGILNAFMQRIRHESASLTGSKSSDESGVHACGVWEYQKRGALHFHLLIGIKDEKLAEHLKAHHQRFWRQVLLHYSKKTGVDLFARKEGGTWKRSKSKPRTEWAKVRKSVGRYMSKYLAKSARELAEDGWFPPSSWHYVSEPVWEQVKAARRLDVVTLLSREVAIEAATGLAEIAQEFGGKVYPMSNPFSQETCGYVVFFDNEEKDACYERLVDVVEQWRVGLRSVKRGESARAPELIDFHAYDFQVELMFEGVPLDVVAPGYADFCAPSSASEEGGGRW